MMRELIRTLVYTDMHYLYADSTNGHKHAWWPQWEPRLGLPIDPPATPTSGQLVERQYTGGRVLWLDAKAKGSRSIKFDRPMTPAGQSAAVREVACKPGRGAILLEAR